jgi:hypothetical protein
MGSAADDEAGLDMIHHLSISNINNIFIEYRQVAYWKSIKEPDVPRRVRTAECGAVLEAEEVYAGLVKENPPRSRSGSRGTAGLAKTGGPLTCLGSFGRILFGGAAGCFSFVAGALNDAARLHRRGWLSAR